MTLREMEQIVILSRDPGSAVAGALPGPVTIGGLSVFRDLENEALRRGYEVVRDLRHVRNPGRTVLLWDIGSLAVLPRNAREIPYPRRIGWCLESPLVAHRAYHRLNAIAASEAAILYMFPGASRLAQPAERVTPLFWPNESRATKTSLSWEERDFLVLVASNKRRYRGWEGSLASGVYGAGRMLAARILAATYRIRGTWTVPDLYKARLAAIRHFGGGGGFNLYGMGWNRRVIGERGNRAPVERCYRGPVASKEDVLSRHRFALCFENTSFPGYITEKLFDCLFAGTIPIYLGAPDIAEFIPEACFIDVKAFSSFDELESHLHEMTPDEARERLKAIETFLSSSAFERFTNAVFVSRLMALVDRAAGRGG